MAASFCQQMSQMPLLPNLLYRVIGYFLMSNAYFAVATDSQFDPVFKARDEATVKTIDRSTF